MKNSIKNKFYAAALKMAVKRCIEGSYTQAKRSEDYADFCRKMKSKYAVDNKNLLETLYMSYVESDNKLHYYQLVFDYIQEKQKEGNIL